MPMPALTPARGGGPRAGAGASAAVKNFSARGPLPRPGARAPAPRRGGRAGRSGATATPSSSGSSSSGAAEVIVDGTSGVPVPVVKIDNTSDPFATVVRVTYGEYLEELLDTVAALKALRLNIVRAKVTEDENSRNKFYVTEKATGDKVTKSERLEDIRTTIIQNLMMYHPEATGTLRHGRGGAAASLHAGKHTESANRSDREALGPRKTTTRTIIKVKADPTGARSKLDITTVDRPGLLVEIVSVLKDINIQVLSAEVDTEGMVAHDEFYVSYHGEALSSATKTLVVNALQYYLARGEVDQDESY